MSWRELRRHNAELLIDNSMKRQQNEILINDIQDLKRHYGGREIEKERAVNDKIRAMLMVEGKDRALIRQTFDHNSEVEHMIYDIKSQEQLIRHLSFRLSEEQNLNKLQNRKILELEDELERWKAKYESDMKAQGVMIKRLQLLLEDQTERNIMNNETLNHFEMPRFQEEKYLKKKLIEMEKDNLRLKDELNHLLGQTTKVKAPMIVEVEAPKPKADDRLCYKEKCDLVELMNRRFDQDLVKYLFTIWRLRFMLKKTIRMKGEKVAVRYVNNFNSDYILVLWRRLKTAIAAKVFDIYLRSKNEGVERKSYILFKINIEELIGNDEKLLIIAVKVFLELCKALGDRIPRNDRIRKLMELEELKSKEIEVEIDDEKSVNHYGVYDAEVRDTVNEWIERQIVNVQKRRRVTGKDKAQKEMVTLFRYNAIYYKCLYPYSNKQSYRVDKDLFGYLETLVCRTLHRQILLFEKDPPVLRQSLDKKKPLIVE